MFQSTVLEGASRIQPHFQESRSFYCASGCPLLQMWGSRYRHYGPQHSLASPQKASGKFLHLPPHGPLPQPGYIL